MADKITKLVVNCATGQEEEVELEGEELDEYLERQDAEPEQPPASIEDKIADALEALPNNATFGDIRSTLVSKLRGE
jgi:hypothetical protein